MDAIVILTWSKVCIAKAITISITISIQKLSSTVNHTSHKLSFVDNWSVYLQDSVIDVDDSSWIEIVIEIVIAFVMQTFDHVNITIAST